MHQRSDHGILQFLICGGTNSRGGARVSETRWNAQNRQKFEEQRSHGVKILQLIQWWICASEISETIKNVGNFESHIGVIILQLCTSRVRLSVQCSWWEGTHRKWMKCAKSMPYYKCFNVHDEKAYIRNEWNVQNLCLIISTPMFLMRRYTLEMNKMCKIQWLIQNDWANQHSERTMPLTSGKSTRIPWFISFPTSERMLTVTVRWMKSSVPRWLSKKSVQTLSEKSVQTERIPYIFSTYQIKGFCKYYWNKAYISQSDYIELFCKH